MLVIYKHDALSIYCVTNKYKYNHIQVADYYVVWEIFQVLKKIKYYLILLPLQQDYNTQAFLIDDSVIMKHQLIPIFGSYTVDRQRC